MKICKHNDGLGRCGISGEYCVEGPCHCEELIEYEPVRHGRWENYSTTMQECSVCKRHTPRHRYTFCPHCGADMRGDSDE